MTDNSTSCYTTYKLPSNGTLNSALKKGFYQHYLSDDIKRTHLFEGRYENIYIDEEKIPEIKTLLNEAINAAAKLLKQNSLQAGLWFNLMPPQSVTNPHTHDDDDELLSAVYYICVPEDSGNLIIHHESETITVKPEEGLFVFFKPNIIHEVLTNNSKNDRLSVGINFGKKKQGS